MRPQAADRYRSQNSARRIVIISRDNTRTYTFSPLALFGGLTLFLVVSLGFLAATTYLVFRDDLFTLNRVQRRAAQARRHRTRGAGHVGLSTRSSAFPRRSAASKRERLTAAPPRQCPLHVPP